MINSSFKDFISNFLVDHAKKGLSLDNITIDGNEVYCSINFYVLSKSEIDEIKQELTNILKQKYSQYVFYITFIRSTQKSQGIKNILKTKKDINIEDVFVVASAKGGVGKSTVAVNLAYSLKDKGKKVAILDGDIYGPSIQKILKGSIKNQASETHPIPSWEGSGITYCSSALFVKDNNKALELKAPIVTKLFNQMLTQCNWGEIDTLIIDMPPGTGDLHINLLLNYNVTGIVFVSTPQSIAQSDTIRSISMYKNHNAKIIGIIENMSSFICPCCNEEHTIFGSSSTEQIAQQFDTQLLAKLPLHSELSQDGAKPDNKSLKTKFTNIVEKIYE